MKYAAEDRYTPRFSRTTDKTSIIYLGRNEVGYIRRFRQPSTNIIGQSAWFKNPDSETGWEIIFLTRLSASEKKRRPDIISRWRTMSEHFETIDEAERFVSHKLPDIYHLLYLTPEI